MLQSKFELFASNAQAAKTGFIWHNTLARRLSALLYAQEGRPIDCEKIRDCYSIIKQNTGVFSTFRGDMALCVATMLSLSPNPQGLFGETLAVYELLKGERFRASNYLVVAAFEIARQSASANYANAVSRTRAFYDGMKARNYIRTGRDDYIFAAMLGLSDLDAEEGSERIRQLYNRLKGEFWDKNSVHALSQVLVLGGGGAGGGGAGSTGSAGGTDAVLNRALALRDALRAHGIKLDKTYTLTSLGVLSLLPSDIGEIARDIFEARQLLRAQKGLGPFSVPMQELLLYAVAIVANERARDIGDGLLTATLSTSISNIIIAQQTAMIAAISASTAGAAAASSK
ncbi:MAG: DUF4003 domain-containing protein [Oscillospiraceae bacterium]|nr:DUF4003 domain-containing protein [Oscillospiraceae bacterium]